MSSACGRASSASGFKIAEKVIFAYGGGAALLASVSAGAYAVISGAIIGKSRVALEIELSRKTLLQRPDLSDVQIHA